MELTASRDRSEDRGKTDEVGGTGTVDRRRDDGTEKGDGESETYEDRRRRRIESNRT